MAENAPENTPKKRVAAKSAAKSSAKKKSAPRKRTAAKKQPSKSTRAKSGGSSTKPDKLQNVARSIGSTLGTLAKKATNAVKAAKDVLPDRLK